jgi:hypothetical protein
VSALARPSASASEWRVLASPIWIRLLDAFTERPPRGPLAVALERRVAPSEWIPFAHPHRVGPGGDLAFLNLGRTNNPLTMGTFDVRVTVTAPGLIAEDAAGAPAITTTVTAWAPDAPSPPAHPDVLTFFPGPAYAYPAGLPLLAGRVVDPAGVPAARARVAATVVTPQGPRTEEARTGPDGFFRLPLRWATGAIDVTAALDGRTGAVTVTVPADLSTSQLITLT